MGTSGYQLGRGKGWHVMSQCSRERAIQRESESGIHRQQMLPPGSQLTQSLLKSLVVLPDLTQARQQGGDVIMLRLVHNELRPLSPLTFQQRFQ